MANKPKDRCHGKFTLLELLIVIAIIAILMSMLLPALNRTRGVARTIQCVSNQKQFGIYSTQYSQDYNEWLLPSRIKIGGGNNISGTWYHLLSTYAGYLKPYHYATAAGSVWACPAEKYPFWHDQSQGLAFNHPHYITNTVICGDELHPGFATNYRFNKLSNLTQPSIALFMADSFTYNVFNFSSGAKAIAFRHHEYDIREKPWNSSGSAPDAIPLRNMGNAAFFDGHVQTMKYTEIRELPGKARAPWNAFWDAYMYAGVNKN